MKHPLLFVTSLFIVGAAHATITLELDAGHLYTSAGTGISDYLPSTALLQLIVSDNGTFATPSAGSFVGGDTANEVVLENLQFSYAATDETDQTFSFTLPGGFTQGDSLLLRWWPTITLSGTNPSATPVGGSTYGQGIDTSDGGLAWTLPADGTSDTGLQGLFFLTGSSGGSLTEAAGEASHMVAAVPEPATFSLMAGALAIGAFAMRRRRK